MKSKGDDPSQNPARKREAFGVRRGSNAEEDRRWLYGDIFYKAVGEVVKKHGECDNHGIGLGMDQESMYDWLWPESERNLPHRNFIVSGR